MKSGDSVLGILVDALNYDQASERILDAAAGRLPLAVSALAVHGIMTGVLDSDHAYRLNHLDLIVPDGQPVRWALNLRHRAGLADRVYGPQLMLHVCEKAAQRGVPIALFGSTEDVLERLSSRLVARYPALQIAFRRASCFRRLTAAESDELMADIRDSGAQITFVGLGCPRQEIFAFEHTPSLSMPVMAVGAAFDFHAGSLAQAPGWMQRSGLEWAFRLAAEPRRLWRRYLGLNPLFLMGLALQALRFPRFDRPRSGTLPPGPMRFG